MSALESQNPHSSHQSSDSISVDPLLDSNQPEQTEPDKVQAEKPQPKEVEQTKNFNFAPDVVIDAQPILMVSHYEFLVYLSRKPSSATRRNTEEMAKRPEWLPGDWKIDLRTRTSGATAGIIDRYYISPAGKQYRSKVEVFRVLGIEESPKKREVNSGESSKKKKSGGKRKKAEAINPEKVDELPTAVTIEAPQEELVAGDAPQETD